MAKNKKPKIKLTKEQKQAIKELVRKYQVGTVEELKNEEIGWKILFTTVAPLSLPVFSLVYGTEKVVCKQSNWAGQVYYSNEHVSDILWKVQRELTDCFNAEANAETWEEKQKYQQEMKELFDDVAILKPAIKIVEGGKHGTEDLVFHVYSEVHTQEEPGVVKIKSETRYLTKSPFEEQETQNHLKPLIKVHRSVSKN
jgi:hypothetical protein